MKPLTDKLYTLEKYPGKGGWTYARIPEILQAKDTPFGWVRVRGSIDGYEIKNYHLMPMGDGKLLLPVRAEIRKNIRKKEGDVVHVVLYADDAPVEIPEELELCLLEVPHAMECFLGWSQGEQKRKMDWIYGAKKADTRANRILRLLEIIEREMNKVKKAPLKL